MNDLPQGIRALHPDWPEARWNLSGLFVTDRMIWDLIELCERRFGLDLPLASIHGSPSVAWNGGRRSIAYPTHRGLREGIQRFNGRGIGITFTFSNHLLEPDHLQDSTCNHLLRMIDNGSKLNGVIVSSDLLLDHVRTHHPELKVGFSITKTAIEGESGSSDYYRHLLGFYDWGVVHPDDCLDISLLKSLIDCRDQLEIIVNESCVYRCQHRKEHYDAIARSQLVGNYDLEISDTLRRHEATLCRAPMLREEETHRSCNLTRDEMKACYELGYRRFKIQGRNELVQSFLYDIVRYVLEPDQIAPIAFKRLLQDLDQKLNLTCFR